VHNCCTCEEFNFGVYSVGFPGCMAARPVALGFGLMEVRAEENVLILLCFCRLDWVNVNTMFLCTLHMYTESDAASSLTICLRS
jgi:hypothetical protein